MSDGGRMLVVVGGATTSYKYDSKKVLELMMAIDTSVTTEIPAYRASKQYKKKPVIVMATYNKKMFRDKGTVIKWGRYRDTRTASEAIACLDRKWSFLDFSLLD